MKLLPITFALLLMGTGVTLAAVEEFGESFNGNGPFERVGGGLIGFDNPDWGFSGQARFQDGGLWVENFDTQAPEEVEADILTRRVLGRGNFVERLDVRDAFLGTIDELEGELGNSQFFLTHHFTPTSGDNTNRLALWVIETDVNPDDWRLGMRSRLFHQFVDVPSGPDISLTIAYDDITSQASFSFDNNLNDDVPALLFGPFSYDGIISESHHLSRLAVVANEVGEANGLIDNWSLTREADSPPGDFNNNGVLDGDDIELLSAEVRAETDNLEFDVIIDGIVDEFDRNRWIERFAKTYFGDSNLDGQFNSADLVEVFQANEYEDDIEGNSNWANGDWNGDGDFNSRDLVVAFADGGYEMGPRAAVRSVPEPSGVLLLVLSVICLIQTPKLSSRSVAKNSR